jgi:hypothetical protein
MTEITLRNKCTVTTTTARFIPCSLLNADAFAASGP